VDARARWRAIEYDPNRSALIALIVYGDGIKELHPGAHGLKVGATVISAAKCENNEYRPGDAYPLRDQSPLDARFTRSELIPGVGLNCPVRRSRPRTGPPSKTQCPAQAAFRELRLVNAKCRATIGEVRNSDHINESLARPDEIGGSGAGPRVRGHGP